MWLSSVNRERDAGPRSFLPWIALPITLGSAAGIAQAADTAPFGSWKDPIGFLWLIIPAIVLGISGLGVFFLSFGKIDGDRRKAAQDRIRATIMAILVSSVLLMCLYESVHEWGQDLMEKALVTLGVDNGDTYRGTPGGGVARLHKPADTFRTWHVAGGMIGVYVFCLVVYVLGWTL